MSGDFANIIKAGTFEGDLFTQADMMVQKTIEKNLRKVYPYIRIVGEEDKTHEMYKMVKSTVDPSTLKEDIVNCSDLRHTFQLRKEKLKAYFDTPYGHGTLDEEEALYFN